MPRRATPEPASSAAIVVSDLVRRASNLAKAAQAQAWGTFGGVIGYFVFLQLNRHSANSILTRTEACSLGYVLAVALYTLVHRSMFAVSRRLAIAKMFFVTQRISEAEYAKIRAKILKGGGLL